MRWIKQGTCSVGLTINRYLGRLRSSKTMITREGEIMANLKNYTVREHGYLLDRGNND